MVEGEEEVGLDWGGVVGAHRCRAVSGGGVRGSLRRGTGVVVGMVGEEEGGIDNRKLQLRARNSMRHSVN